MTINEDLSEIFEELNIPAEAGGRSDDNISEYVVISAIFDEYLYRDDSPLYVVRSAAIQFFSKSNYIKKKNNIIKKLLENDFYIKSSELISKDEDGFFFYEIEVEKSYLFSEEEL